MYIFSRKGYGETIRIHFDSEDVPRFAMNFSYSAKISEGDIAVVYTDWCGGGTADAEKSPNEAKNATHRSCPFAQTPNIMYKLSWRGVGEPFFIA